MAHPRISELRKHYASLINSTWDNMDLDKTVHLITWNPKPRFYGYDKYGQNDYDSQWHSMLSVLNNAPRCLYNYAFTAEISEVGKLHIHGFYQVHDKIKYHKSFLPSLRKNGFIKHSKARSADRKVIKYHKKDISSTIEHFNDRSVPIVVCPETIIDLKKLFCKRIITVARQEIKKVNMLTWMDESISEDWTEI